MSLVGLVAAILIFFILLIVTIVPFLFNENDAALSFRNKQRERALAYYERVLTNIRDLDDDLATDKINHAEYELEREKWMSRGVELLAMLDELDKQQNIVNNLDANASDAQIDDAIEAAIQRDVHDQTRATEVS